MARTVYFYCDPDTRKIVATTFTRILAADRGNRIEIIKDDTHAAFLDPNRENTYRLNDAQTDLELDPQPLTVREQQVASFITLLVGIGYTGTVDPPEDISVPDVVAFTNDYLDSQSTDADKIAALIVVAKLQNHTLALLYETEY